MNNDLKTSEITIATSINPDSRIDIQKEAIESWIKAGFRVVSLNETNEIKKLSNTFRNIDFIPQIRTAKALFAKPYIYISDILAYLKTQNSRISGIINSDIYFKNTESFSSFLIQEAENSLIFGPRLEVKTFKSSDGKMDPFGFDYFIFDKKLMSDWKESRFCIGLPSWDHWFPLVSMFNGRNLKKIITPFALHTMHPVSLNRSVIPFNIELINQTINYVKVAHKDHQNTESIKIINLFNQINLIEEYENILLELEDRKLLNYDKKLESLEKMATFCDKFSSYVIKFLNKNSTHMKI
ncbi:MAG: hypothetical protein CMM67_10335 [Rhodospirillaceae bacterium]|nr:hypothetical protein [Rhodospirillaceae bacterium]OUT76692.1 MAG: hypothetical protein CBB83_10515 [Rhodospirillaceae bacterium TMED23]|tara:strand:+ start:113 stop:1003 length:891 start_codon:yes stop_codon:yes gene_type:complete